MKRTLAILTLLWAAPALAQPPTTAPMTRLVVRDISPTVNPTSFRARPRTVYRVGTQYVRVEEEVDPDDGVHDVLIRSGRDTWIVDLGHKTVHHEVSDVENPEAHMPIIVESGIRDLEMGREFDFMKAHGDKVIGTHEDGGKTYELHEAHLNAFVVRIMTLQNDLKPLKMEISDATRRPILVLQYDEYSEKLPADPKLFQLPDGIPLKEVKA